MIDLSNCENEQIHIVGKVQSHGLLFVLDERDLKILQISTNCKEKLGLSPETFLGSKFDLFLSENNIELVKKWLRADSNVFPQPFDITMIVQNQEYQFDAYATLNDGLISLELEPFEYIDKLTFAQNSMYYSNFLTQMAVADSIEKTIRLALKTVAKITNYDRILLYKFDELWNGKVIDEYLPYPALVPFLNQHFPASDVPSQARELMTQKISRHIPDSSCSDFEVVPNINPKNQRILDMTLSEIRYPSEMHLEYLRNMNVGGSLSVSIVVNNKLWGLLACHHTTPKFISYYKRFLSELIAKSLGMCIGKLEANENILISEFQDGEIARFVFKALKAKTLSEGILKRCSDLVKLVDCDGVAIFSGDELAISGDVPPEEIRNNIKDWLSLSKQLVVFHTNSLFTYMPEAREWSDNVAGILALRIADYSDDFIIWFRKEKLKSIDWAGNPNKAAKIDPVDSRISPRKSFDKWTEEVKYTSDDWHTSEINVARKLRKMINDVIIPGLS